MLFLASCQPSERRLYIDTDIDFPVYTKVDLGQSQFIYLSRLCPPNLKQIFITSFSSWMATLMGQAGVLVSAEKDERIERG
jgi:hypothetical protein